MENTASKQSSLDQQATGAACATNGRKSNAHSPRRLSRLASAGIVTAYRDKSLSVSEIAKRFDVSQVTVIKHAKAAGVKQRHKSTKKLSETEVKRILSLHDIGLSKAQIGRMVGRSTQTVRRALADAKPDNVVQETTQVSHEKLTLWGRIKRLFGG